MSECLECKKRDIEITQLNWLTIFHQEEARRWRVLYSEQRGGEIYDKLQKDYGKEVAENIGLRNELNKIKGEGYNEQIH